MVTRYQHIYLTPVTIGEYNGHSTLQALATDRTRVAAGPVSFHGGDRSHSTSLRGSDCPLFNFLESRLSPSLKCAIVNGYMTKEELEKLKEQLLAEREKILEQMKGVAVENPAVKGDFEPLIPNLDADEKDYDDTVTEAENLNLNIALESTLERRLEEINRVIRKIDDGTYGTCSNCTNPIHPERLKANPIAALCISCAQRQPF